MGLQRGFLSRLFDLHGRTALIIGGHGEIAAALAAALADLGCNVALAARKLDRCAELAARLEAEYGVSTLSHPCDIALEEQVVAATEAVLRRFGQLDVLVVNAGTSRAGASEDMPLRDWQRVLDVNLTGTFVACREAARHMLAKGRGSIINVASTGGLLSYRPETAQIVPYTTTKAAVLHLTADLAAQWAARGVRVNAIAPGPFNSGVLLSLDDSTRASLQDAIPMKRLGAPADLAGALAFLASDASSYVTGHALVVDGGGILV